MTASRSEVRGVVPTTTIVTLPPPPPLPDNVPYKAAFIAAGKTCPEITPRLLAAQARAESSFNPRAVGPMTKDGTAKGLTQFIDSSWRRWGEGSVFDPNQAIKAQARYMCALTKKYGGSTTLALAAYNAGSGNVSKYGGVPPFRETIGYIQKIQGHL